MYNYSCIIVEDEAIIRRNLAKKVPQLNEHFQVKLEAYNGLVAWEYIQKNPVDLIITDIQMPIMTGLELAKKIHVSFPSAKILIISGYNDFKYAQEAIKYNVCDYLLKPISNDNLIETLLSIQIGLDALRLDTEQIHISDNNNHLMPEQIVLLMQEYIMKHFTQDVTLEQLADYLHFSPSYLGKVFKKYSCQTPLQYYICLRINEAKKLLLTQPKLSIEEIGRLVGYSDAYYFSRIFKKQTGIYPSAYRTSQNE